MGKPQTFSPLLIAVEVVTVHSRLHCEASRIFQSAFNRGRGCYTDGTTAKTTAQPSFSPLLIAVEVVT